jgi:anti-anti-sigma factor
VSNHGGLGEPGVVVAHISGELDAADTSLDAELRSLLAQSESRIVVDLTNVTFIDSTVVRALVVAHRTVTERDGWVRVVYTHHLIGRVIELCGLHEVFPQYASVECAVRGTTTLHAQSGTSGGA